MTGGLGLPHRLWRVLPQDARRAAVRRAIGLVAPRPDPVAPTGGTRITVAGEIGRASGLGEAARLMVDAIASLGLPVDAIEAGYVAADERRDVPQASRAAPAGGSGPGELLLLQANPPTLPLALLQLGRRAIRGRRIVGLWAWELPVAPPAWRTGASFVHEVWAPSAFTARALETLLPGRVRSVPLPLALSPPVPSRLGRADFGLPDDAVVVLVSFSLASSFERKNPLAAIAAFRAAFADDPARILVLKVGKAGNHAGDLARIRDAIGGCGNIRLETRTLPRGDSHALTAACDIVLSLHRSEGFGLVPAEAMLLGKPVVATDWSATAEFLDASCGIPVGHRLVEACDPRGIYGGIAGAVWAEADIGAAARALRALADDPERRARLGAAAHAQASRRMGGAALAAALEACGYPTDSRA